MTRELFEDAANVGEIRYRLHPIDVGFDLRAESMAVDMGDSEDALRVSCADEGGARVVLTGSRDDVISELRRLGYEVKP